MPAGDTLPRVEAGGDESVGDLAYDGAADVLGGRRGERLTWTSSHDGVPLARTTVQADGVALDWGTPQGTRTRYADALAVVERSVAVVRGPRATCWTPATGGVSYRPPVPQTESIERTGGRCHAYLRPGRSSLLRHAEVDVAPRRSLAARADAVRARDNVVGVRLEPGAASLDGRRADRLTVVVARDGPTVNGEPAGTWRLVTVGDDRLQATWGATPRQWRAEGPDARRFFASVRLPG